MISTSDPSGEIPSELFRAADVYTLGGLAAARRAALHGENVYFGITLNLNPTNICELRCPLCAFSRDEEDPDAYFMTLEQVEAYLARYRDALLRNYAASTVSGHLSTIRARYCIISFQECAMTDSAVALLLI